MSRNLLNSQSLSSAIKAGCSKQAELQTAIKALETKLTENSSLQIHITNYMKTKPVFEEHKKSGYFQKFYLAHQQELLIHRAARAAFNECGLKSLPTIAHLRSDYGTVLSEKGSWPSNSKTPQQSCIIY